MIERFTDIFALVISYCSFSGRMSYPSPQSMEHLLPLPLLMLLLLLFLLMMLLLLVL